MTTLGLDGPQDVGVLAPDGCCPISPCQITARFLACNMIQALPKGPLWDRSKAEALAINASPGFGHAACPTTACHTMVAHAIFTANWLHTTLMDTLWPLIRESNPYTCFDTVDDWLDRFRWRDCFASHCRSAQLGPLTPLEVMGACGCVDYVPPNFPPELILAVKLGTVKALARMKRGVVPTIDTMNFVLAPLGAEVLAVGLVANGPPSPQQCDPEPCEENNEGDACCPPADHPVIAIRSASDVLPRPARAQCAFDEANVPNAATIKAYVDTIPGSGLPLRVWPGVLAAECILRSVIRPYHNVEIQRW